MAAQTTMSRFPAGARAGQLYAVGAGPDIGSYVLSTAAGVEAGRLLLKDTTEEKVKIPAGDVLVPRGFTIQQNWTKEGATVPAFAQKDAVALLKRGYIWLTCVDAIAAGDVVRICHTGANAGLPILSATNSTVVPGIRCERGAGIGGLGLFEVALCQ